MDYIALFEEIFNEVIAKNNRGKVADYIPELGKVDADNFGVCITTFDGKSYGFGDYRERFSIQSIAKVLSLTLAYQQEGVKLWKRVGMEPSGTPFNSLIQLENDFGIPRNPFINAGALVICDLLISNLENPKSDFLDFVHLVSGNNEIDFCPRIAESEKQYGFRNAALVNFMKSFGNIHNAIDEVLDFYFNLCSINMNTEELSNTFLFLASNGISKHSDKRILNPSQTKRINAVMQLCGFYDEAGEFSLKVGLPGKSGVGGGIVAIHPGQYCISVWSPRLNKKGNSYRGLQFLELFTTKTGWSIF